MAKPKPPEDKEAILIRVPQSLAGSLRELARNSRTNAGLEMSLNQYCAVILTEAAAVGMTVQETVHYTTSSPLPGGGARSKPKTK